MTAGLERVVEIWCHAPAAILAERYRSRLESRSAGHPGEAYIPELIALSAHAAPTGRGPLFEVDTTRDVPWPDLMAWLDAQGLR